jgi:mRNA-degrading endonuclease YafQ of YafQ-DinJ toxin-antitoxin module
MKLLATPRFLTSIPANRRVEVLAVMKNAGVAYGQPHLHAGLGLRRIRPFMECRCGLDLRLIFQREGQALVFHLCGTHDEVESFLKNQR